MSRQCATLRQINQTISAKMKKTLLSAALSAACLFAVSQPVAAAPLLFDRGLPSLNLNNAAGAARSNVTWSASGTEFTGDDFSIGVAGEKYRIDTITVWGAQFDPLSLDVANIALYFGRAGSALSLVSEGAVSGNANGNPNITHSFVTYADGVTDTYEGWGGGVYGIAQTVFSNLNLVIDGGVTYYFGVDGDQYEWWSHASNAALSGTPQQGADGKYLIFDKSDLGAVQVVDSQGNGWDKSSDINVRVTGEAIPEPATLALASMALLGLAAARRRRG